MFKAWSLCLTYGWSGPSGHLPQSSCKMLRPQYVCGSASATPNTSLNHRTRYGGPSWPGLGYAVHFPSPGQAVPPQRSG